MRLIITIDTEEDSWLGYEGGVTECTTRNGERLPALQSLFDEFGVRPTYLVTYMMASDPAVAGFLHDVHAAGRCEIGAHCHPWNTPPFVEERSAPNSMLFNLPPALQHEKIRSLTELIEERCGVRPVCFRAGRWGYDEQVGLNLARLGYVVDSSITPYIDWSAEHGPDFSGFALEPYWRTLRDVYEGAPPENLVEVPATVGFLQRNFELASRLQRRLVRSPLSRLKLNGLLYKLRLLNRVWLCPEHHSLRELIVLTESLRKKQFPVVNLMFHSGTLQAGLTPFVRSISQERDFISRIRGYVEHAVKTGIESATLIEAAVELAGSPSNACNDRQVATRVHSSSRHPPA